MISKIKYCVLNAALVFALVVIDLPIYGAEAELPPKYVYRVCRPDELPNLQKMGLYCKLDHQSWEDIDYKELPKKITRHINDGSSSTTAFISATASERVAMLWANIFHSVCAIPLQGRFECDGEESQFAEDIFFPCNSEAGMVRRGITRKNKNEIRAINLAIRAEEYLFAFYIPPKGLGIIPNEITILSCAQRVPYSKFSYNLKCCKFIKPCRGGSSGSFLEAQIGDRKKIIYTGSPCSPNGTGFFSRQQINAQVVKNDTVCKIAHFWGLNIPKYFSYSVKVCHDFSGFSDNIAITEQIIKITLYDLEVEQWLSRDKLDLSKAEVSILFFTCFVITGNRALNEFRSALRKRSYMVF